jgi:hypothetical protein
MPPALGSLPRGRLAPRRAPLRARPRAAAAPDSLPPPGPSGPPLPQVYVEDGSEPPSVYAMARRWVFSDAGPEPTGPAPPPPALPVSRWVRWGWGRRRLHIGRPEQLRRFALRLRAACLKRLRLARPACRSCRRRRASPRLRSLRCRCTWRCLRSTSRW